MRSGSNRSLRFTPASRKQRWSCRESLRSVPPHGTSLPFPPCSACMASSSGRSAGSIGTLRGLSVFVLLIRPLAADPATISFSLHLTSTVVSSTTFSMMQFALLQTLSEKVPPTTYFPARAATKGTLKEPFFSSSKLPSARTRFGFV